MKSVRSMIRAPVRMDRVTDDRSGCSRQDAARKAANHKGAVRQVRFYDFTPAGTNSGRGDFCFWLLVRQPLFVDMDAAPGSAPYASSLAAGERRPRKCRDGFRDDSWNDSRDDSCDDGLRGDAGARRIGPDRRRGITFLLRPVRRRCFRRHRPVRRCSCRRCGSTWQCVSPRRSVCRSGS